MLIFLLGGLVIGAVAVIFVLQNIIPVTITFVAWHIEGSLAVVLMITLFAGMLASVLILLPSFISAGWQMRSLKKQNKKLEDDAMINTHPAPLSAAGPAPVETEPAIDLDEESK